jgi:hypothetical protein
MESALGKYKSDLKVARIAERAVGHIPGRVAGHGTRTWAHVSAAKKPVPIWERPEALRRNARGGGVPKHLAHQQSLGIPRCKQYLLARHQGCHSSAVSDSLGTRQKYDVTRGFFTTQSVLNDHLPCCMAASYSHCMITIAEVYVGLSLRNFRETVCQTDLS